MNKTLAASLTFAGTIIGAGVLGIPAAIANNGFFVGSLLILLIGAVSLTVALMFGEVALRTKTPHHLPGFAEKYSGKRAKHLAMIFAVLSMYGAIIAYIHGSGAIISQILGIDTLLARLIFFVPLAAVTYLGIQGVEKSETILTGFVLLCIVLISAGAFQFFNPQNLQSGNFSNLMIPIGILIFAFEGLPAIPEMNEILGRQKKNLKKSIIIGCLIPLVAYLLFAVACIGALGTNINEVATLSLAQYGNFFLLFGNFFAIFAMATGFVVLAQAIAEIYNQDCNISQKKSWAFSCLVPLIGLLIFEQLLALDFVKILSLTGTLFIGPYMFMVVYVFWKARKSGERKPEYELKVPEVVPQLIMVGLLLVTVLSIVSSI